MQASNVADSLLPGTATSELSAYHLQQVVLHRDDNQPLVGFTDHHIANGTFTCITGPSGSGKSSLLMALAGLNNRYSGRIASPHLKPIDTNARYLDELSGSAMDEYHQHTVGIVFQQACLLPELSAIQNARIAASWAPKHQRAKIDKRVRRLLHSLGFSNHDAATAKLSGGEQQRVAIARALAHSPSVILADEPTASLDKDNSIRVLGLLQKHTVRRGGTLIICTHDQSVIDLAQHHWHLENAKAVKLQ